MGIIVSTLRMMLTSSWCRQITRSGASVLPAEVESDQTHQYLSLYFLRKGIGNDNCSEPRLPLTLKIRPIHFSTKLLFEGSWSCDRLSISVKFELLERGSSADGLPLFDLR